MSESSSSKIIAIDVDGVVIDTCMMWKKYLLGTYKLKYPAEWLSKEPLPYNLTELFHIPEGEDGYDWWYSYDLYDNLAPRKDALEWISKLKEDGYTIIFVSFVIGYHHYSKEQFINKWFPYNDGTVLTKNKKFVKCDYLIDDCYKNLNEMDDQVSCIKFRMDWRESVSPIKHFPIVYNWEDTYKFIKGDIE